MEEARAAENLPTGEISAAASTAENLLSGETSAAPSTVGDLPSGEIPDVQIEQETVEEQEVTQGSEEAKIYQEEFTMQEGNGHFCSDSYSSIYGTPQARSRRSGNIFPEEP